MDSAESVLLRVSIKVAVRGCGRLSQISASRNPFRSSSTAEYSAVVFVVIFAVRPKF